MDNADIVYALQEIAEQLKVINRNLERSHYRIWAIPKPLADKHRSLIRRLSQAKNGELVIMQSEEEYEAAKEIAKMQIQII